MSQSRTGNESSFPYDSCNLLLGKGGSGAVYLARHHVTGHLAAVKRCYPRRNNRPTLHAGGSVHMNLPYGDHEADQRQLVNEDDAWEENHLETVVVSHKGDNKDRSYYCPSHQSHTDSKTSLSPAMEGQSAGVDEPLMLQFLGRHTHIVEYFGAYTSTRKVNYFAMELMDSDVGREIRARNNALMSEEACTVLAYSVLEALYHIHSRGVAHRDVKPGNIFLRRASTEYRASGVLVSPSAKSSLSTQQPRTSECVHAFLGDFSASHFLSWNDDSTVIATRGTLFYKAPEQLLGKKISDFTACDMWALGCTILEMCTGSVVFFGLSELQVQLEIFHRLGSNFSDFPRQTLHPTLLDNTELSPAMVDLLRHLLALDYSDRFTAKQALEHPVFMHLRERQSRMAEKSKILGRQLPNPVPVWLNIPLSSSRCMEVAQLRVSFRPVALTPFQKRTRAEFLEKNEKWTPNDRGAYAQDRRNTAEKEHAAREDSIVMPQTPMERNSFLSDGPSIHWSQMRSLIAGNSETCGTAEKPPPPQSVGQQSGWLSTSPQVPLLLPASEGEGWTQPDYTTRDEQNPSLPRGLSIPPAFMRTTPFSAALTEAVERRSINNGSCRPVLVAASGTTFTAGNLRAFHDFETSASTRSSNGQAYGRALTFSSDGKTDGAGAVDGSLVGQSAKEGDAAQVALQESGVGYAATPRQDARKMLMFESPNAYGSSDSKDDTLQRSDLSGSAKTPSVSTRPSGRMHSVDVNRRSLAAIGSWQQNDLHCPALCNAGNAVGAESNVFSSEDAPSCRSTPSCTPVSYFRSRETGRLLPDESSCRSPTRLRGGPVATMKSATQTRLTQLLPPPLPISMMQAGQKLQSSVCTPTLTMKRVKKRDATSASYCSSSPSKSFLREQSLNSSLDTALSALCSPVPRRQQPVALQGQQHIATSQRFTVCSKNTSSVSEHASSREPPGRSSLSLSSTRHDALAELGDALANATRVVQQQQQKRKQDRHCTPSLEQQLPDGSGSTSLGSCERSMEGGRNAFASLPSLQQAIESFCESPYAVDDVEEDVVLRSKRKRLESSVRSAKDLHCN